MSKIAIVTDSNSGITQAGEKNSEYMYSPCRSLSTETFIMKISL